MQLNQHFSFGSYQLTIVTTTSDFMSGKPTRRLLIVDEVLEDDGRIRGPLRGS